MYLEMIFGKNKEQTMRQLQFRFDPLPVESAGICLFHQRWIKTLYTQPFGLLCIKYGLILQELFGRSFTKKTSFRALEKWKMALLCNESENSPNQHSLFK